MRHERAIAGPGDSTESPSSGLAANYKNGITRENTCSIDGLPGAVAPAAGLAPLLRGEREPANADHQTIGEGSLPGGPGSLPFDVAAVLCGHDIGTLVGEEAARADFRVWDLAEAMRP